MSPDQKKKKKNNNEPFLARLPMISCDTKTRAPNTNFELSILLEHKKCKALHDITVIYWSSS